MIDQRFPKYIQWIFRKLDFLGLPNLGILICGIAILGFIGTHILGAPMERFVFDPQLVLQGEWWRLFAFPTWDNPIWLLFFLMYVYFVMGALEQSWGPGPLTVFTLMSYGCAIAASFAADRALSVWVHVVENVSLAFGTLFPEIEFYLFFVLPVKAKWLALFAGSMLFLQFVLGSETTKIFLVLVMFPYLFFFGPLLIKMMHQRWKISRNRKRFGGK